MLWLSGMTTEGTRRRAERPSFSQRITRASSAGAYAIKDVPAGRYYLVAIPDDMAADWNLPATLEDLAREATEVVIDEGQRKTQDLRTVRPRRLL